MNVQITSVKENPLLDRRETKVEINHQDEETPSKEALTSRIAAEKDIDEEKIEVDSIYTGFGSNTSKAYLKIFSEFEYDEELKQEAIEEDVEVTQDLAEAVSGTITEAKETLQAMEKVDWKAAIEAEKEDKNRTTLIDWLKNQR